MIDLDKRNRLYDHLLELYERSQQATDAGTAARQLFKDIASLLNLPEDIEEAVDHIFFSIGP